MWRRQARLGLSAFVDMAALYMTNRGLNLQLRNTMAYSDLYVWATDVFVRLFCVLLTCQAIENSHYVKAWVIRIQTLLGLRRNQTRPRRLPRPKLTLPTA